MLRAEAHYLSVSQVARRLGLCDVRVRQLIAAGRLPAVRTVLGNLIPADAVEALAAQREKGRGGVNGETA